MKPTSLLVLALTATTLAACDGLSEAFTAHTDVVATAGSQELSVDRLADLLGKSKMQIPVNQEVAALVARDLWVPYQLLAVAASRGDSLSEPKAIDAAALGMLENAKLGRFMTSVSEKLPVDPGSEVSYNEAKGGLYSARHILFLLPQGASTDDKGKLRNKAEAVRTRASESNFAALAKEFSGDGSAQQGGELGVFPGGKMVKPFTDALAKLKPGQISPVVETEFGYHIIQRNTWDRAKTDYLQQSPSRSRQVAESAYIADAQKSANVEIKADAGTLVKEIAKDPLAFRKSSAVLATFKGGQLTGGKLALVLLAAPQSANLMRQIQGAPDSLVMQYVKNMAQREVLVRRADSLKVTVTAEEFASLHRDFVQAVVQTWQQLGIDPKSLADSGKTPEARERIAAARVEAFMDKVMAGTVQPLPIPAPLQIVLMDKYTAKVNAAGVDRAVEKAIQVRATADSARKADQPASQVPLPGAVPPGAQAPGAQAPGAPAPGAGVPPKP